MRWTDPLSTLLEYGSCSLVEWHTSHRDGVAPRGPGVSLWIFLALSYLFRAMIDRTRRLPAEREGAHRIVCSTSNGYAS